LGLRGFGASWGTLANGAFGLASFAWNEEAVLLFFVPAQVFDGDANLASFWFGVRL
jgi:hypothetical protein